MNLFPFYKHLFDDDLTFPDGSDMKMFEYEIDVDEVVEDNDMRRSEENALRDASWGFVIAKDMVSAVYTVKREIITFPYISSLIDIDVDNITCWESCFDSKLSFWENEYPLGSDETMTCGEYFRIAKRIKEIGKRLIEIDAKQLKFEFALI